MPTRMYGIPAINAPIAAARATAGAVQTPPDAPRAVTAPVGLAWLRVRSDLTGAPQDSAAECQGVCTRQTTWNGRYEHSKGRQSG
jgi:hypothetical protein